MLRSVGITGTNGKTTTTTWIAAALATLHAPVLRATTLGYFLGDERLPSTDGFEGFRDATRLARARGATLAAVELTSQALWGGAARAWPCSVGVFTNLSRDHLDAHGDVEHYLASKAQLFVALPPSGTAVLNGCDPSFPLLREVVPEPCRVLTYGSARRGPALTELDARVTDVRVTWAGTSFTLAGEAVGEHACTTLGVGDVFAENAAAAILGAHAMGVPVGDAVQAVAAAPAPPGRFEVVNTRPYVVVDYAHSPDALARTCATARHLAGSEKLTIVFGAGGGRDTGKRSTMGSAVFGADRVVITTDNPRNEDPKAIAAAVAVGLVGHRDVATILDRSEAIERAVGDAGPSDVVVVCGRGHETEQILSGSRRPFSDLEIVREALGRSSCGHTPVE
jgi:UDP-N-acetylmuramoyl-L-alanyl-D-glutamate--2,6-diaminopimelate ligase